MFYIKFLNVYKNTQRLCYAWIWLIDVQQRFLCWKLSLLVTMLRDGTQGQIPRSWEYCSLWVKCSSQGTLGSSWKTVLIIKKNTQDRHHHSFLFPTSSCDISLSHTPIFCSAYSWDTCTTVSAMPHGLLVSKISDLFSLQITSHSYFSTTT